MEGEILNTRSERKKVWRRADEITGISRLCDHVIVNDGPEFRLSEPVRTIRLHLTEADVAADVSVRQLRLAIRVVRGLPDDTRVNVVLGGTDRTFPRSTDKRHRGNLPRLARVYGRLLGDKRVTKVFIENMDSRLLRRRYLSL